MLDHTLIVSSALSSFNNAALLTPAFFWYAVFAIPLFALVYFLGNEYLRRIPMIGAVSASVSVIGAPFLLAAWLVLMPGNYAVLRDFPSLLPYVIAIILFGLTIAVSYTWRGIRDNVAMPGWMRPNLWGWSKYPNLWRVIIFLTALAFIGASGAPTVSGFLLQAAAVLSGIIVGRHISGKISPVMITLFALFGLTIAIAMQPEFFRFGQMANLTLMHMMALILTGMIIMAAIATRLVVPAGMIYRSAFVKLKWMFRIGIVFTLALFALTESVLFFIALNLGMFLMFAMSVWNATTLPENLAGYLWSAALIAFGVISMMPIISAVGVLHLANVRGTWPDVRFLL